MISRDTTVHAGAVVLALVILIVADYAGVEAETGPATIALFLLFYGLVLGGAHLYLAVRGEDGMVPVEARWRYLATLTVLLGTAAVILYAGDRSVASVELSSIGLAVVGITLVAYFLTESIAGYRASRPQQ